MAGGGLPRDDSRTAAGALRAPSSRFPARGGGGSRRVTGTEMGQKPREQNATNVVERDENCRDFKGGAIRRLVRDEGVAGSNPATPTKYPLATLNPTNFETSCTKPTQTRVADGCTLRPRWRGYCGSPRAVTAPTTMLPQAAIPIAANEYAFTSQLRPAPRASCARRRCATSPWPR